jgi:sarcosine oxidase
MFDILVIGKGLFGAAAARVLSGAGAGVAIVGPDEPAAVETHVGPFASHYDEGRVTRQLGSDLVWSRLAQWAIAEYRALEADSGVPFYTPTGVWHVMPEGEHAAAVAAIGAALEAPFECVSGGEAGQRSGLLRFPDPYVAFLEGAPAGHINPRALIRAQLTLVKRQGGAIRRDTVVALRRTGRVWTARTATGAEIQAEKALVAGGAFSNAYGLLPAPLPLRVKTETILLVRLGPAEAARLAEMPTVLYEIARPALSGIYLLPPLRYPDGHFYLKMGCNTAADRWPETLEAMRAWFIAGDSEAMLPAMRDALFSFMPGLAPEAASTARCIVCYTSHGRPYLDEVADGLFVSTGGNGHGAKSSVAIGRLAAARMGVGDWPDAFAPGLFAVPPGDC